VAAGLPRTSARPSPHLDPREHQGQDADDHDTEPHAGVGKRVILGRQRMDKDPRAQAEEGDAANGREHDEPGEAAVGGTHGHGADRMKRGAAKPERRSCRCSR
jgi:hypothetical protein